VLIVMLFTLLEHESLRDRLLRLIDGHDLRTSTLVLNDVGERLSRYFVSQFTVNFGVGAVIWLGLLAVGLPHAMLWGGLTALLRFVPYIGVLLAAVPAVLLGAAVEPGWALMGMSLAIFLAVELLAAQVVEPLLYGHSTGLSPLSVVIATIFWSALWGPVGLLLATPLTLCLLVAGRHLPALKFLDILLGDGPR
jgi:predicted PurR-regulated permease PerM